LSKECKYCHTTFEEVLENGFVGCKHCYEELDELQNVIDKVFCGKKHKGRGIRRDRNG